MENRLNIKPEDKCIIIAPHADDESIGCGGVILKYNNNCRVVVLTDGSKGGNIEDIVKIRLEELKSAMEYAQISNYENLMIKDKEVRFNLKKLEELNLSDYDYVFVPNDNEFQIDHCCILKKVKNILKFSVKTKVVCYEVWSPIPNPNLFLDISDIVDKKNELISLYKSQTNHNNYAGATIALNKFRSLRFRCEYVETFYEVKTFIQNFLPIFDITKDDKHKIITILGLKLKFKLK